MGASTGTWTARIGWLVAAVAPPLVAFWQHVIAAHPVLTGAFLVGYEGLLAVGRRLFERRRDRLVERVDQALGRRFSSFDRRYREFVAGALRYIDVKGLATIGFYTPELDEVFVDVSVTPSPPIDISPSVLPNSVQGARGTLADFLDAPQPAVLAIIGGPGVGKTTLLLHTAREAGSRHGKRRRTVPILLFLRDHVRTILSTPDLSLPDAVRGTLGRHKADEPAGWFEHCLADGRCVVLLDGLDEVAGQADRRALADWVERQISQYPKNDFVISSRPHGYLTATVNGATVLHALPLSDDQVTRFVRGWCRAFETAAERYNRRSAGEDPLAGEEAAVERADVAAAELLGRLTQAPELYELTANPMLLTMVVNVHRFRGQLPGSRADLYGEICQVMLGRRALAKKLPVDLGVDKKEMVLRGLAFAMMRQRVRDLRRAEVVAVIEPLLGRVPEHVTAAEFLDDVGSNGILVERENGLYAFAHLTFQEYLAASHIREKGKVSVLTDAVEDVWWRETTLLYAARSDADPVIRACLASGRVPALSLAFDCEAQPSEIAPELRAELKRLLDSAVDPDTEPERRRLMARVMVARHLRHRTSSHVCTQPVTTNLYRLFLRETAAQPPDEPWLLGPDGDRPILGVYGRESLAFVRWINTMTEATCRLVTRDELADPVVRRALAATGGATWLHPEPGAEPELWWPPDQPHPHQVDAVEYVTPRPVLAQLWLLRAVTALEGTSITPLIAALTEANELDSDLELGHTVALAHALAADAARALVRSKARAKASGRDNLDFAHALARIADHGDAHTRAEAQARETAAAADDARTRGRTSEVVQELIRCLTLARDLDRSDPAAAVLGLDIAFDHAIAAAQSFDTLLFAEKPQSELLAHRRAVDARAELAAYLLFAGPMGEGYILVDEPRVVRPDLLADAITRVSILVRGAWPAMSIAARLKALALPVFTWQEMLTPATAAAIRLATLCVAEQAGDQLAEVCREIAAGVTLLERRTDGRAPLTETIMLAEA